MNSSFRDEEVAMTYQELQGNTLTSIACVLDLSRPGLPTELRACKKTLTGRAAILYCCQRPQSPSSLHHGAAGPELTRGSLMLTAHTHLAPGAQFLLPLDVAPGIRNVYLCEVRFTRRNPRGVWSIGAQLTARLERPSDPPADAAWQVAS